MQRPSFGTSTTGVADAVAHLTWPASGVLFLVMLALTGFTLPTVAYAFAAAVIVLAFLVPYSVSRKHYVKIDEFVNELNPVLRGARVVGPWGLLAQLPDGLVLNVGHGTFVRLADRTLSFWKFFDREGTSVQLSPEEVAARWRLGPVWIVLGLTKGDPLGEQIESVKAKLGANRTAIAVLERPRAPANSRAFRDACLYLRIPRWIERAAVICESLRELNEVLDEMTRKTSQTGRDLPQTE